MKIKYLQPTSLIDFPDNISSILFLGGCNFRCGYCYNRSLVDTPNLGPDIPIKEAVETLKKKVGLIDGVVITGGEPTVHADLGDLMQELREIGLKIKLDTNGTHPDVVHSLIEQHLVDYIAMDIKSDFGNYEYVTGIPVLLDTINTSIALLLQNKVPYEFRTTVWKALMERISFETIFQWIEGANAYFLQNIYNTVSVPSQDFFPVKKCDVVSILELGQKYVKRMELRGDWH